MPKYYPQRGDIIFTDFDPAVGKEQNLNRPALILCPNLSIKKLISFGRSITSKVRGHGFEVLLENTETKGAILCHQVKMIDYHERGCKFWRKHLKALCWMY